MVDDWLSAFCYSGATCIWVSFNSRWTLTFASAVSTWFGSDWEFKPCVQTFTFGQHNHHDLGNNHRPLWRLRRKSHPLFPDRVRVPSWRQLNGDKRADPRGRVPGDVMDFPRVTGNSKQRRKWHPTQLHEDLIERCLLLTCPDGARVLDPFGGTGTTLRVCKKLGIDCDLIELDSEYCERIREEHPEQEIVIV
jgi:DNA modification methylase